MSRIFSSAEPDPQLTWTAMILAQKSSSGKLLNSALGGRNLLAAP